MSIYTRWGGTVEITANCGQHQPAHFDVSGTLVRSVTHYDDEPSRERYHFAEFLRADDGLPEILAAISVAPPVTLDAVALAAAIEQAL